MKKSLQVTIKLEMEIPDDWEIVQHPDGVPALNLADGTYMYMSFLPMLTQQFEEGSEWTSNCSDDFSNQVLDMVQDEDVAMKLLVN